MKCQKCEKPATFHITELTGEEVVAFHFCKECAETYLQPNGEAPNTAATLSGMFAEQLKVGQTAEDLSRLDQKTCPVCGISFFEFRQSGRLGCPQDYEFFAEELEQLMMNIHGATEHIGKSPKHGVPDAQRQADMIRLRREMKGAVENEEYELASKLRDEIRNLQTENKKESNSSSVPDTEDQES